jgi:hypothetical protein
MATNQKLRELILYVARRCQGDERFGKTKLNKILFWTDFLAYQVHGVSITGQQYVKKQFGPVGKETEAALTELMEAEPRALDIGTRDYFTQTRKVPIALREPSLDPFTGWEIGLVENIIRQLWHMNATELSDLSHQFVGWRAAQFGEQIPYEAVFLDNTPVTDEEEAWARQVVDAVA